MYYTGAAMGENRSEEQKVKATTQTTKALTPTQKIASRNESPHLRHSEDIVAIPIGWRVDWCKIQVQQWVRTGRENKKWKQQHRQKHLPQHKKSP
jgi:hypothetical protein